MLPEKKAANSAHNCACFFSGWPLYWVHRKSALCRLPILSHGTLKRCVLKGRDLIKIILLLHQELFCNETDFFSFLLQVCEEHGDF